MVWGAIWVNERLDLFIMDRDEVSKRERYSSKSYINVLNNQLPIIWNPGMVFMQDNAPIHTANLIKDWFRDQAIPVLDWPPYSPDLNPIEIVWAWLKQWITTNYPDLKDMGKSEQAYERLYGVMHEAWESIPQEKIDKLIKSMGGRVNACKEAKGWHTRY